MKTYCCTKTMSCCFLYPIYTPVEFAIKQLSHIDIGYDIKPWFTLGPHEATVEVTQIVLQNIVIKEFSPNNLFHRDVVDVCKEKRQWKSLQDHKVLF